MSASRLTIFALAVFLGAAAPAGAGHGGGHGGHGGFHGGYHGYGHGGYRGYGYRGYGYRGYYGYGGYYPFFGFGYGYGLGLGLSGYGGLYGYGYPGYGYGGYYGGGYYGNGGYYGPAAPPPPPADYGPPPPPPPGPGYGPPGAAPLATPPAPLAPVDNRCRIRVLLPADATLWFGGEVTDRTGPVRVFLSPPVPPGQPYTYTLRARWTEAGHLVEQVRNVTVQANETTLVTFGGPPPRP